MISHGRHLKQVLQEGTLLRHMIRRGSQGRGSTSALQECVLKGLQVESVWHGDFNEIIPHRHLNRHLNSSRRTGSQHMGMICKALHKTDTHTQQTLQTIAIGMQNCNEASTQPVTVANPSSTTSKLRLLQPTFCCFGCN